MMGWHGMGGGGFLWMLIVGAVIVVPFWRLLPRFGIPSWVALVPLGAVILLYLMAFRDELNGKGGAA